jgi:hypothetical protein
MADPQPLWVIGIDPGVTGALAAVDLHDRTHFSVAPTPVVLVAKRRMYVESQMVALVQSIILSGPPVAAVIERQHQMPVMSPSAAFHTGEGYGLWRGILAGLGVSFEILSAQVWKKEMLAGMPREKGSSFLAADRLFPGALESKKQDGEADALLIAEFRRRQLLSTPAAVF